jgi:hypothetical protein
MYSGFWTQRATEIQRTTEGTANTGRRQEALGSRNRQSIFEITLVAVGHALPLLKNSQYYGVECRGQRVGCSQTGSGRWFTIQASRRRRLLIDPLTHSHIHLSGGCSFTIHDSRFTNDSAVVSPIHQFTHSPIHQFTHSPIHLAFPW